MSKRYTALAISLSLTALFATQASGHYAWVNADDYSHHTGEMAKINIGYGR